MRRTAVMKKIKAAAERQGLAFEVHELANHTGVRVSTVATTLKRHSEIDEVTARKLLGQLAPVFGK